MTTMHTSSKLTTVDWPMDGTELDLTLIEHEMEPQEDLLVLDFYPPGANEPAHTFQTFRHGFGGDLLSAALADDRQMARLVDWWLGVRDSQLYAAHRILIALDNGAAPDLLANRLRLTPADLAPTAQYGRALDTLVNAHLVGIDAYGRYVPGPDVDEILCPDDAHHARQTLGRFYKILNPTSSTAPASAKDITAERRTSLAFPSLQLGQTPSPDDARADSAAPPAPLQTSGRRHHLR